MKTIIFSRYTLILFSLFVFTMPSFGGNDKDSLYSIEVDGRIAISQSEISSSYKVELFCHNILIESGEVVDGESFILRVKKNSLYNIRILREGYLPMVITIDTNLDKNNIDKHKFNFDAGYFLTLHGFNLSLDLKNM